MIAYDMASISVVIIPNMYVYNNCYNYDIRTGHCHYNEVAVVSTPQLRNIHSDHSMAILHC